MSGPEIVVVGGGPAGAAAAAWLAEAGRDVLLLERTSGAHDKVCGEFVSGDAGAHFATLGLDPAALGAAPMERVRLVREGRIVETPLGFPAWSLSRRRLDEALLDAAAERGARVRRGVSVRSAQAGEGGVAIVTGEGERIAARAMFLATGKHELRGHARGPGIHGDLIGLKMHYVLAPHGARALAQATALLMFPGGYAGLQPLANGKANLCLLVAKARFRELGSSFERLVADLCERAPAWREALDGARPLFARPLAIAGVPYGHVGAVEGGPIFRLGDQMAVIPSFAGDGIAIALHSARMAVEHYLRAGPDARSYHEEAARHFGPKVRAAAFASRLLEHEPVQALATCALAAAPSLVGWAARATRLGANV